MRELVDLFPDYLSVITAIAFCSGGFAKPLTLMGLSTLIMNSAILNAKRNCFAIFSHYEQSVLPNPYKLSVLLHKGASFSTARFHISVFKYRRAFIGIRPYGKLKRVSINSVEKQLHKCKCTLHKTKRYLSTVNISCHVADLPITDILITEIYLDIVNC